VGDNEDGEVVFFLELHEFHHEYTCCFAFVGGIAEVCEVVNDDDFGEGGEGCIFDVFDYGVFVVIYADGVRVDFGSDESVGEDVTDVVFYVVVSELELFVGELAVHVEDVLFSGYCVGHLDGVDGFAEVGVGKEAADFALVP